eukprot:TRINITY_DN8143_c0_g1_i1.p1 TRINITY_DN8143_c0_g1~~TRINITY_DN8143_c0_g1_i1.p1  ORF type:complete len:206 (-),score=19.42 TRINITY_DN8143_c0_g1_i1:92-709(-)
MGSRFAFVLCIIQFAGILATPWFLEARIGNRNNHNGEIGVRFTPQRNLQVTHLGRALFNGGLANSVTVTIWRVSDESVVTSASVGPSSAVEGGFAFETLPASVELQASVEYRLSQLCFFGMTDRWYDGYDVANHDSSAAVFLGGCYSNVGFPAGTYTATDRWTGMVNFKFVEGPPPCSGGGGAYAPCPSTSRADFLVQGKGRGRR